VREAKEGQGVFITDNGNPILDCAFGPIASPEKLEARLKSISGVVDSGIFAGLADMAILGDDKGTRSIQRKT
jgi:ribose 5-phosphate isomerase A